MTDRTTKYSLPVNACMKVKISPFECSIVNSKTIRNKCVQTRHLKIPEELEKFIICFFHIDHFFKIFMKSFLIDCMKFKKQYIKCIHFVL